MQTNTVHFVQVQISPHNLQLVVRRPPHLGKAQATFDTLEILASDLVTENMRLLITGV